MVGPSQLIELRKRWVRAQEMARELGIDRTTLWKREGDPADAPTDFWPAYARALRAKISPQAQEALQALDTVAGAMAGAVT
jgi:hypothetical protein